jgi:hypothetical protein
MKTLIISVLFVVLSTATNAQTDNINSAATGKEKRKAEMEKQYEMTKQMLLTRNFVLEADHLQDRYGNRVIVSSTINFLAVDSATAIIQIGSDSGVGPNGVGGITAKGNIGRWKLKENKKQKSFDLSINVTTSIGIYDLNFMIGPMGNATARLTGLRAGQLTFEGDLVPYTESAVYEGRSL